MSMNKEEVSDSFQDSGSLEQDLPAGGTMERRSALKTMGGIFGLTAMATLIGPDTFRRVAEAAQQTAGLSPQQVAQDEDFWTEIQQAFTMRRSLTNLDNAWTCPSPRMVTEAVVRYTRYQEEEPAQQWIQQLEPALENIRTSLARMFDRDPEEIAIVRNATEAMNTILFGIDLKRGDEALTTNLDYSTMRSTLRYRQEQEGIIFKQITVPTVPASMDELVTAFEQAITPATRVILISHIAYLNGQIFPVKAICDLAHKHGIEVVLDAAHSFGHLDFKYQDLNCDYFGTSLHKWLLAPKGTGMMYIPKDKIEKIPPLMTAPWSRWNTNIRKYEEVGTKSAAPFLAIAEAIAFHQAIGSKRKEARLRYLTHYWAERLQGLPRIRLYTSLAPEMSCGIATFGIEDIHPTPLRDYLWEKHQIQTATIRRDYMPGLRISPNLYTTLPELDYFCELIEKVLKEGLPEPYKSYQPRRR